VSPREAIADDELFDNPETREEANEPTAAGTNYARNSSKLEFLNKAETHSVSKLACHEFPKREDT